MGCRGARITRRLRRLNASRNFRLQALTILHVPRVENFGFCLESAVADQGVVNGGTCDAASGSLYCAKYFFCFQGDQRQPLTNVSQK